MTHDPLCHEWFAPRPAGGIYCVCELIERVRSNRWHSLAYSNGYDMAIYDCIAAVEAVQPRYGNYSWGLDADEDGDYLHRDDTLAALRALPRK